MGYKACPNLAHSFIGNNEDVWGFKVCSTINFQEDQPASFVMRGSEAILINFLPAKLVGSLSY